MATTSQLPGGQDAQAKFNESMNEGRLPWNANRETKNGETKDVGKIISPFFDQIEIKGDRWDQLFPYRLIVINTKNNQPVKGSTEKLNIIVTKGTGVSSVNATPIGNPWIFTLPITPQQLNITDQFAINTSATLRGILEEHSGVRFKMINASGSMGVWPNRSSVESPSGSPGILQSLFGGTIEAAQNTANQVQRVINSATTDHPSSAPARKGPANGDRTTGYYNALALQQFLEQYAEAKKHPDNASWRLVFDIPKQNQSIVVTPIQYTWQQNVNKPLEYLYSFQLKGWRRIKIGAAVEDTGKISNQPISPGILQRILTTIGESRKTMSSIISLIGAVRSDVNKPLDVLRQTTLFVKDLAGVAVTAADLPFQLQRDYDSAINDTLTGLSLNSLIGSASTDPAVIQALKDLKISSEKREGLSLNHISAGQLGLSAHIRQSIDPANNVFSSPASNFSLIDQAPISSLKLNSAQQRAVDDVISSARATTIDTLKQYRSTILELALQLSNNFGAGSAFYDKTYGRPAPSSRIQPMTLDEYDILRQLYDVIQGYDILTATTQVDDAQKQTSMDYVAGLADLSGITFNTTAAKVLVPVPFGKTIEGIAARYLGDPQRWLEIATLNNLRDPYIDENGFQISLLSNATGRQITVGSITNLYIGQRVLLMSSTQTPSARAILGIDRLSDTSFLITLDGLANLNSFLFSDKAYLQAYLPGTVNSQQKIFIPSNLPIDSGSSIVPPAGTLSDPLTGLSKVDWLLTDSGDVAINNFGDLRYSSGLTNIIQALKIKIGTQSKSMLLHPNFGLGIKPGIMNSEIQIQELYDSINKMIQQDQRFQGVTNLQISSNGPTLQISIAVAISGQTGVFPVTFTLT
jgi:hypothetical protein